MSDEADEADRAWREHGQAPSGSCPICESAVSVVERDGWYRARCSIRSCAASGPLAGNIVRSVDLFVGGMLADDRDIPEVDADLRSIGRPCRYVGYQDRAQRLSVCEVCGEGFLHPHWGKKRCGKGRYGCRNRAFRPTSLESLSYAKGMRCRDHLFGGRER